MGIQDVKRSIADEFGVDPADVEVAHVHEKREPCDHVFTETGDPDADYCTKCGRSIWHFAFMECP